MNSQVLHSISHLQKTWRSVLPLFVKSNCLLLANVNEIRNAAFAGLSLYSTDGSTTSITGSADLSKKQKVSKAMRAYLQRAQKHDEFIRQQQEEFKVGKRHLANMMGEDPESFTQDDIDNAIKYLFPSGLFDPKARPLMKPPEKVFPERKDAEFDETGRPYHFLFYTGKPNYYGLLHDVVGTLQFLNNHEDKMIRKLLKPESDQVLELIGTQWIPKEELEKILVESLLDSDYNNFVLVMDRLVKHPYSFVKRNFIMQYRRTLLMQTKKFEIIKPEIDEDGRQVVKVKNCLRKTARGQVTIRYPGEGRFLVNGEDINYFKQSQEREQILFPLIFSGMINKVDIESVVTSGGPSGQAGAIRWGISWGLRSFVDADMQENMRLAGLLTRDYRIRERKKPGQEKARKKYTWKKR